MNTLYRILWISLLLLQGLDVFTTYLAFTRYKDTHPRELNPFIRDIVEQGKWLKFIFIKVGSLLVLFVIFSQILKKNNYSPKVQREVSQGLLVSNAFMAFVIISNTVQLIKMRNTKKTAQ